MKAFVLLFTFMLIPFLFAAAQPDLPLSPSQIEQIQEELRKRNITKEELIERLNQKGVNLEEVPPEELPAYQAIIMDTVNELEAEKRVTSRETLQTGIIRPAAITPATETIEQEVIRPEVVETPTPEEERIMVYGHEPFTKKEIKVFHTTEGARAPDTYILGAGDQIRITIFGDSQADMLLEINSSGYIQPSQTPQIYLKGLTIAQARNLLAQRLSQFYSFRPEQFALTIQTARTITVNIFGESRQKGSFTMSALNTAFNALAAAGGPTEIGSVRNIQHIRGNDTKTLDVYAFMHNPSIQFDFDLQHNDIIYIPVSQKVVRIAGAVKRPKRYELIEGETIRDLIDYSGGINYDTYPDFLQIERVEDGERSLQEWTLAEALRPGAGIALKDGDIVRLRQIEKPLEQFVEVEGAVFYGGRYDLRQNPTLSLLLERAEVRPQAKTDLIFVERIQPDESVRIIPVHWEDMQTREENFELEPKDLVRIFNQERYRSLAVIGVSGNVRNPFERRLHYDERISLSHALALAGGALPTAAETAYVVRTNLTNPDFVEHIPIHIINNWDFELQPGDELFIYSQSTYTNIPQISIQGAVNNPFSTTFEPELNITDLLKMAGGLTEKASLNRIDIFRLHLTPEKGTQFDRISLEIDSSMVLMPPYNDFRLKPYDQLVVRQIPMFDIDRSVQLSGEIMFPGLYPLESRRMHLSELIQDAGGLTPQADLRHATLIRSFEGTGPVGINLEKAMKNRMEERFDPVIMPGDIITIPRYHNTISIRIEATRIGELARRDLIIDTDFVPGTQHEVITFVYQGPHSARWYIENFAGGFAPEADKRSVTVTKRNGQVKGTKSRLLVFNNYPTVTPGSTIALAYEPQPEHVEREEVDWDRLYARTMSGLTTLLTLIMLMDRIAN